MRASLDPRLEAAPVKELTLEGGEEGLGHGVVVPVTDAAHGRPVAGLLAAQTDAQHLAHLRDLDLTHGLDDLLLAQR
jgi:hypothetical protein